MKHLLLITSLISITTVNLISCKDKIVYRDKPTVNDSTSLKAEMKAKLWNEVIFTILQQSNKLSSKKLDSLQSKKASDTIQIALNVIVRNIQDSNTNAIFKK